MNWQQSANQRLAVALAISLVLHGLIYTGWQVAPATAAFFKEIISSIVPKSPVALQPKPKVEQLQAKREVPMTFVEVDPAHATPEPPKETKNYSTANSLAANPIPKEADVPKIEGSQTHVVRTMDVPKPQPPKPVEPKPPEPNPPEPKPPEEKIPEPKPVETKQPPPEPKPQPKPAPPGDLAMNKATPKTLVPTIKPESEKPVESPVEKPRERPRTLADARARNPALAGEKVKQDGGVERRAHVSMLDARRSEFGDYDLMFIGIVQARWYQLLENNKYMLDRRGKVSLTFRLYQDGRISQVEVAENTVGDMLSLLCQKAVLDPAPFPKWPTEMRRQIKVQSDNEHRDVKFTFYYD